MQREPRAHTEALLAAIVLPLAILIPTWLATPTPAHEGGLRADPLYYTAMALRDSAPERLTHVAPWCWRVLTPFQVSLWPGEPLPLPEMLGRFEALAFLSNWLALALLYGLLRRVGASPAGRVFGVLAYAGIHWTVKFSFRAPAYVDFQMQLLVIALLLCVAARRYWLVPALLGLAALQKETTLLLLPALAWARLRRRDARTPEALAWVAASVALPLLALVVVRTAISPVNEFSAAHAVGRVLQQQLLEPAFWPRFGIAVFSGLGLLPLLLARRPRVTLRFLCDQPFWAAVVACFALALAGGVDKARLFLPMTPALVVIAVAVWRDVVDDAATSARTLAWGMLTLALHAYLGHHFEPMGAPGAALARLAPIHAQGSLAGPWLRIAIVSGAWLGLTALLLPRRAAPGDGAHHSDGGNPCATDT